MSSNIQLQVDYNHTEFTPGDTISGKIIWTDPGEGRSLSLRLFWFTEGKGTQDIEVVHELSWPASQGNASFSIDLPNEPYSFSGTLVSISWAIEAVLLPEETSSTRYNFQLTPDGREIHLTPVENPVTGGKKKMRWNKK